MGRHALGAQSASPAHDERVQLYDRCPGQGSSAQEIDD